MMAPSVVSMVPSIAPMLILGILTTFCEVVVLSPLSSSSSFSTYYSLWIRKVRHREAKQSSQDHTVKEKAMILTHESG